MGGMIGAADVGGTKIRYAVFEGLEIKSLGERETPKESPLWIALYEIFRNLDVDIISIATMGPLKLSEGKIISNPHSRLKNQELARPLMEKLDKLVIMINDAVAGAVAEANKRETENLVYVAFGTGVGVGAIVDGKPLLGREGNAHEVGHAVMAWGKGLRCGCGKKDHAEALLGGSKIAEFMRNEGFEVTNAKEAFELIKENEKAFELFSSALNAFLATIVAAYDPEVIVLGGGVYFKNKEVFEAALDDLENYLLWERPSIEAAAYGELSPLYGAVLLAVERPEWLIKKLAYVGKV